MVNRLDDDREFKDSVLGMIPKDWDVWNIEEIIDNIIDFRGKTPLKIGMTWGGGDIPALSANNVEMGKINLEKETNYASEALYKKWMNKGDTKKGDIIITMEAPLGNIAQIPDNKKYILSQRVLLFKTKKDLIYNDFFKNFLLSDLFQNKLKSYSSGTTATGIQQSKLLKLPIIVPPIPEQQQIAKILDRVDKAIAQTETLIAKYKRVKTGLMQDLLTRGIDENGQLRDRTTHKFKRSPLGMIPDEWEVVATAQITKSLVPGRDKPNLDGGGIPWITIPDIDAMYISASKNGLSLSLKAVKSANARLMPKGTVIMSCVGEFGIATITREDVVANQQLHGFICSDDILPEWLVAQINASGTRIDNMATQTTIKYLNKTGCESILLALPKLAEQKRAISLLSNSLSFIATQEKYLAKLHAIKTGLMQDLLTGKISIKPLLTNEP